MIGFMIYVTFVFKKVIA